MLGCCGKQSRVGRSVPPVVILIVEFVIPVPYNNDMSRANKKILDKAADQANKIFALLEPLELSDERDKQLLESIKTDLSWAAENCTVIGLHEIGKALHDRP